MHYLSLSLSLSLLYMWLNLRGITASLINKWLIKIYIYNTAVKLNFKKCVKIKLDTLVLGEDHIYFTLRVEVEDEDDFIEPMEEDFDNMQHPMELMLLNRACIPYVAM